MDIPRREEIAVESTWDLRPLYPSLEAWSAHRGEAETRLPQIAEYQGRLGESVETLHAAMSVYLEISQQVEKLYTYAHLLSDQDTSNATNLGFLDQAFSLHARFAAVSSYISPELLALDEELIARYLKDPKLAEYERMLRETLRYRPHTLSKEEENLLARGVEVFTACDKVFSQLNNADLEFGKLKVDGVEKPLTHGNFILFLKNRDRNLRREAYQQYYAVFSAHKHTLAATLSGAMRRDIYLSRVKNFPSAIERALFSENIDRRVYDNLVSTVSELIGPLHRYYRVRKELLGLPDLALYDVHVPLIPDVHTRFPFHEAAEIILEAVKPLGEEYVSILRAGLRDSRWVDVYENKGKRSGAYSSGCYGSPAYMLLNYKEDNIGDLFTLAHEAGHSMHTTLSNRTQKYQDHDYTIFVAEVASTLNEQLLLSHLRKVYAGNKPMLAFLINHQLDEIKNTLYRQTMFAEFEREVHAIVEKDEPLTVDVYRAIYGPLLKKYFGADVSISDDAWIECFRIPHFYSAFYVYKYATGISAAISLAKQVTTEGAPARERYLNFLRAGRSKYPLEILREAGVDMASPAPIRDALQLFDSLLSELASR